MRITPESVAAAARGGGGDDMPPVMFVGGGPGHLRAERAEAAATRFAAAVRAGGGMVAFDRIATDPGALDEALAMSQFNTACLLGRRQVCVLRRVDELPPEEAARLKRLAASTCQWWAMSAASMGRLGVMGGFFLQVRSCEPTETAAPDVPRITKTADVAAAVASGATLAELSEAFRRLAVRRLPASVAFQLAARLDTDVRTNKRPLMLSALIEDAVREADELSSRGAHASPPSPSSSE